MRTIYCSINIGKDDDDEDRTCSITEQSNIIKIDKNIDLVDPALISRKSLLISNFNRINDKQDSLLSQKRQICY